MDKKILVSLLIVALLAVGAYFFPKLQQLGANPGPSKTETQYFLSGFTVGDDDTSKITEFNCNTKTFDFGGVSSTVAASTTVTLTGAALGDISWASFDAATSSGLWRIHSNISGATTATVIMSASETVDISTSTITVCYIENG